MCAPLKRLIVILLIPVMASSCIQRQFDDCGMYLEFIFDYNMEYADAFNPQVNTVDVYIFDEEGKYLFHRHANTTELINNKRMHLNDNFQAGIYRLLTIGGMSEHFRFTNLDGNNLTAGVTTIEEVKLYLHRTTSHISHEFSHLWFAQATNLNYKNASVFPVYLVRNTNKFHVMLQSLDEDDREQQPMTKAPYTFEIVTPESAEYGHNNNPLAKEIVTYHPYYLQPADNSKNLSVGKLNTMRLFDKLPEDDYRLVVRDTKTSEEIWNYDLMNLLKKTKPDNRPDGTRLPVQEYLDRQGEWNIIILHRGGKPDSEDAFLALGVKINGWIIWLNDIEI